ncbi:MAG: 23S rRNA (guanosine(2251)-2'-O)-methyltransferase RlmB [Desulfobacterales bacterium]|nr:23S rRNA (guanosine(2251)-2'-O)-methyltransferase RlmB [Desulfobacterales bacterium]
MKTEILYGVHSVTEALAAGRRVPVELYIDRRQADSIRLQGLLKMAESRGAAVRVLDAARLAAMSGGSAQPAVALRASAYPFVEFSRAVEEAEAAGSDPILVLDSIVDPHNLGAIVRSALCAGVAAVLIPKDRCAGPTPAVSKISAGALEHIRLVQVTNLVRSLDYLKSRGRWVAGLDRQVPLTIFSADMRLPLALVIGGEERGLRTLVRQTCDLMVSIPQSGVIDSLNASAAAAVALYEIRRQRGVDRRPLGAAGPDGSRGDA